MRIYSKRRQRKIPLVPKEPIDPLIDYKREAVVFYADNDEDALRLQAVHKLFKFLEETFPDGKLGDDFDILLEKKTLTNEGN